MLILGISFGVSESTANNIFHYWIDILQDLLPCSLFEQFREKEDEYFWIQEILTELELIVDTTEQSIYRPDDDKKQKKNYSGKKKSHTLKKPDNNYRKGDRNSRCNCGRKRARKRCKFTHKTTVKI